MTDKTDFTPELTLTPDLGAAAAEASAAAALKQGSLTASSLLSERKFPRIACYYKGKPLKSK